jgi:hypothetical protein
MLWDIDNARQVLAENLNDMYVYIEKLEKQVDELQNALDDLEAEKSAEK